MGESETRRRTELMALRLLPTEHAALVAVATMRGMSLSRLVRSSALDAIGYPHAAPAGRGQES
jgi:predicted nuclease with RNAse H fold